MKYTKEDFKKWNDKDYCMKAVKKDSDALSYVRIKKVFMKLVKK